MGIIWVNQPEDPKTMSAKKITELRQRLLTEQAKLTKSVGRTRNAEDEIWAERTEDEGDLATISQEKDILSSLHESGFSRLRFIQEALEALDRGKYGECRRCGEEIGENRLMAVPWAMTCIQCQEATEAERSAKTAAPAGIDTAN
jgi:DnaK suppressor protein